MKEKKNNKYEDSNQVVNEKMIDFLIEEKKEEIVENMKTNKQKLFLHKYNYKEYRKDNVYSYENFSNCNIQNNNPYSISNYEQVAFNDYRLIVPKILMQSIGTLEALYLAEIARLSMYEPVNQYGFFMYSKKEIYRDTGITPRQQDRICKKLTEMGLIDTVTYKKQIRKFYRFNDDFTLNFYWRVYRETYRRIKYSK